MGSKISKAVRRPHVNAAAASASVTVPAASRTHNEQWTEPRQESPLPENRCEVPLVNNTCADLAASSTVQKSSAALADNVDAMEIETLPRQSTDSHSSSIFRGLQELPGDVLDYDPPPPAVERPYRPPPPPEPPFCCIICGDDFAKGKEHTALKPCFRCSSPYCSGCLKKMFVDACTDMSRMPPKCCTQVPLHHVRPYLTQEEVALFRAKYEEWSTSNPLYCPVATCSAFVPERLLPQRRTNSKGKQRVDSGVGTPLSQVVPCPSCETEICVSCRNLAHADATCDPLEFGTDKETAKLLKTWGYKRCPKCGNGLKRMFGCNHMECRCGAHFCWVCLKNQENGCDGGCYDGDEDDYSDDEPDREDDYEQPQPHDNNEIEKTAEDSTVTQTVESTSGAQVTQREEGLTSPPLISQATVPQSTPHVPNLDGGSGRYWEEADYDFGGEPTDDIQDRAWDCHHGFVTAKVSLADSLRKTPSATGMECMKCWCTIHPEIQLPDSITGGGIRTVASTANRSSLRGRRRGRYRARLQPYPVRNPFQQPDMVLGSSVPISISHSQPMEGVHYNPFTQRSAEHAPVSSEHVVDTYGNTITTTETPVSPRRASLDVAMLDEDLLDDRIPEWMRDSPLTMLHNHTSQMSPVHVHRQSSFDPATSSSPFSFAYHCDDCGLLVCTTCKDNLMAAIQDNESGDGEGEGA
jgi:hypothetical protein